jgi:hypothetical protein
MEGKNPGPRLPPGEMRERVRALLDQGLGYQEVAERLGVVKSTVAFHARRLDLPADPRFAKRYHWPEIQRAYDGGLTRKECMERFGCSAYAWADAVKRGAIVPRPTAMPIEDLLVVGRRTSRAHLKLRLLKEGLKVNRCEECGIDEWRERPLSLHLHHKNGDGTDNRLENLALLCANCHSQTDTYGGRNGHRRPTPTL